MLVLALNTAFDTLEVSLARHDQIVLERSKYLPRGQETELAAQVALSLEQAGIRLSQIDRIAVVTGPGSFTGLRIGVAYARGLALVTGVPVIGLTSLEAGVGAHLRGRVLACLAAQRRPPGQTWWVQALSDGLGTGPVSEHPASELSDLLNQWSDRVAIDTHAGIEDAIARHAIIDLAPSASTAAQKAARLADPGRHPPVPVYARAPDATLPPRPA